MSEGGAARYRLRRPLAYAITRSGTITVPFVSGDTSKAQAKLSAPKHVPTIIGMANARSRMPVWRGV